MTRSALPNDLQTIVGSAHATLEQQRVLDEAREEMRRVLEQGITLAGRRFVPIRIVTFDLQNRRVEVVRRAGVLPLFPSIDTSAVDLEILAAEVLQTAFASGALYDMLAHLMVEEGAEYVPWSTDAAAARATFFATLVDPADHTRIADTVLWLVLDFFLSASASSPTFAKYLAARDLQKPHSAPRDDGASSRLNTSADAGSSSSAATTTLDAGTPSSAPSHAFAGSIP